MGVMLRVKGKRACFSRPEFHVEAVTYDTMTPTAARAILENIYWKPEMQWIIDGIHTLKPIQTISVMRNFINGSGLSLPKNKPAQPISIEHTREQRYATVLVDVDYIIKAHFITKEDAAKHISMFNRRASSGQCFRHPYLGCREFSVDSFELVEKVPESALKGEKPLGYMLHSIDYSTGEAAYFNAVIKDGFLSVPPPDHKEVKR